MPRKDLFHELVKKLLEVAGWTVTDSQMQRPFANTYVYMDLGAQKGERSIAVEVKSFESGSFVSEWEKAIGQWMLYRAILQIYEPDRMLYLAIPLAAWELFRNSPEGDQFLHLHPLKVIVYNPKTEVIEEWID